MIDTSLAPASPSASPTTSANKNPTASPSALLTENQSVSGRFWVDSNRDGIQDSRESGLANVIVKLIHATTYDVVRSLTTHADGNYTFPNVAPGELVRLLLFGLVCFLFGVLFIIYRQQQIPRDRDGEERDGDELEEPNQQDEPELEELEPEWLNHQEEPNQHEEPELEEPEEDPRQNDPLWYRNLDRYLAGNEDDARVNRNWIREQRSNYRNPERGRMSNTRRQALREHGLVV